MNFPIETPRLILRPFGQQDIEPFARYRSDPDVARYQGWEAPYSLEQAASFVAEMQRAVPGASGQWLQIAVEEKSTGCLAGDCAFKLQGAGPFQAELGMTLARDFWSKGYAAEAVTALLDALFADPNLHRAYANIDPRNRSSARLLERLGFRHEGRFIESLWFKGGWADEDWYAILRGEWLARSDPKKSAMEEA